MLIVIFYQTIFVLLQALLRPGVNDMKLFSSDAAAKYAAVFLTGKFLVGLIFESKVDAYPPPMPPL